MLREQTFLRRYRHVLLTYGLPLFIIEVVFLRHPESVATRVLMSVVFVPIASLIFAAMEHGFVGWWRRFHR